VEGYALPASLLHVKKWTGKLQTGRLGTQHCREGGKEGQTSLRETSKVSCMNCSKKCIIKPMPLPYLPSTRASTPECTQAVEGPQAVPSGTSSIEEIKSLRAYPQFCSLRGIIWKEGCARQYTRDLKHQTLAGLVCFAWGWQVCWPFGEPGPGICERHIHLSFMLQRLGMVAMPSYNNSYKPHVLHHWICTDP
jgi:hypothetical protein